MVYYKTYVLICEVVYKEVACTHYAFFNNIFKYSVIKYVSKSS